MEQLAQYFLKLHQQNPNDYLDKYRKLIEGHKEVVVEKKAENLPEATPETFNENTQEKTKDLKDNNSGKNQSEEKAEASLVCPNCGFPMVKRKAAKGSNAGNEFWGSSGFPKCRSTVSIM